MMKITLTAGLLMAMCLAAQAGTISFGQSFIENNVGTFDLIEVMASPGSTSNATSGGALISATYEQWTLSPAVDTFNFDVTGNMQDTPGLPATFSFFAFNGASLVDSATITFINGSFSSVEPLDPSKYDDIRAAASAPEPAAIALLGSGLIGFGLLRRRLKP